MKQAVKKKTSISSVQDIKSLLGLKPQGEEDLSMSVADKPMEFIPMPSAYVKATHLPGIPMGYMTIVTGWSNTGKSTIKNCLIASCINNGILPVIFETESNFDFKYAIDCGMKATPIYGTVETEVVDEETGEITVKTEQQIVNYEGDFLYYDTKILCNLYGNRDYSNGTETKKKRNVAVIEDIAYCINEILDLQDEGKIQRPICFIWDSVGSLTSYKSYASKVGNNMFDAGALSVAFNTILNNRIPSSRRVDSPYSNTFFCVNKIWNDSMNAGTAGVSIELKGGKSFYYAARLILHVGGAKKASTTNLVAVAKGVTYNYGIQSKITVKKNQLPTPYNMTSESKIACVHNGLLALDEIDAYKKEFMPVILKQLQEQNENKDVTITESDMDFTEVETDTES